jgi:hypothetical protein
MNPSVDLKGDKSPVALESQYKILLLGLMLTRTRQSLSLSSGGPNCITGPWVNALGTERPPGSKPANDLRMFAGKKPPACDVKFPLLGIKFCGAPATRLATVLVSDLAAPPRFVKI